MTDIRALVQMALDTAFDGDIYVYWQRKSGADVDEYIVYTQGGDSSEAFADDTDIVKSASITVRYYYRAEKLDTKVGRAAIKSREDAIETALEGAGFEIPNGKFDAGDVDDIGFYVTVFECEYWRVV